MKPPIILINFKVYENSFGEKGLKIAKAIEKVSKSYGVEVIIAVPTTMINRIANEVEIPVFAQHVDAVPLGAYTGSIPAELIKEAGAKGTLLNHSEKKIRLDELVEILNKLNSLGLQSIVCVDRYELVRPVAMLKPNAVLIEPPELIGTGIAVSKAKPEVITRAVKEIEGFKDIYLIAGAGITSEEDVYVSIKLGAQGIGAASAVMKAREPERVIEAFIRGALRALSDKPS